MNELKYVYDLKMQGSFNARVIFIEEGTLKIVEGRLHVFWREGSKSSNYVLYKNGAFYYPKQDAQYLRLDNQYNPV